MSAAGRLWDSPPPQPHEYHHHYQHPLPILRMKLHWPLAPPPPPEGAGSTPHSPPPAAPGHGPQEQPTLDVLVQPLQLHYHPLCLQQLGSLLPAVVAGTYHEHLMAAVNGLSSEARAAEKAAYLQYLGPAIDVLVKVRSAVGRAGAHGQGKGDLCLWEAASGWQLSPWLLFM